MTVFPVEGGCFCGSVRYVLSAPALSVQHCHCSICRKSSGQLFSSGAVVRRADIAISGAGKMTSHYTSRSFSRQFCGTCGCYLFAYEDGEMELMYFAPGTLDGGVHPGHPAGKEAHIYVASMAEWDTLPEGLPHFDESSPDEIMTAIQREAG